MAIKINNPIKRFDGWQASGAVKRVADTRTKDELIGTINAWANTHSEVKEFLPKLKNVPDKHLGLVADVIELSNLKMLGGPDLNLKAPTNVGKTVFEIVLNSIPILAKDNPNSLDFMQEIFNNTDVLTSKVFMHQTTGGVLFRKDLAEHFKASTPLVESFAKNFLGNRNPFDTQSVDNFISSLQMIVTPSADAKKVAMLNDISEKIDGKGYLFVPDVVLSKVPAEKIQDNLQTFDKFAKLMQASDNNPIDAGEYLTKNTNLY